MAGDTIGGGSMFGKWFSRSEKANQAINGRLHNTHLIDLHQVEKIYQSAAGSFTNSVSARQSGTFTFVDSTPAGSGASALASSPDALIAPRDNPKPRTTEPTAR